MVTGGGMSKKNSDNKDSKSEKKNPSILREITIFKPEIAFLALAP